MQQYSWYKLKPLKPNSLNNPCRGEKLQHKNGNWLENVLLNTHTAQRIHSFEDNWKVLAFHPKMKIFHPKLSGWKGMLKLSEKSINDIKEFKHFP